MMQTAERRCLATMRTKHKTVSDAERKDRRRATITSKNEFTVLPHVIILTKAGP
jgi:hypothetical protein